MSENLPEGWTLPNLRIDRDGDWYDDDVQVTHPGILANLRGNLRKDGQGYFLQTRVRIPVVVEDAPWVVTRVEPRAERLHVVLNDGSEADVEATTVRLGRGDVAALYRFAADHPEKLTGAVCTCGCVNVGHVNNRFCYVKAERGDMQTFTSHAAT